MNISDRIKELRRASGLSQGELAKLAGLAQSSLSYLERGDKTPSVETVMLICRALGVSLPEFLEEPDEGALPEHIRELINQTRSLTPEQIKNLTEFIKSMKGV